MREHLARIVVGIDGSEHSHRALVWAVTEAARLGARLLVVHALRFEVSPTDPNALEATRQIGRVAQHVLDHEVAWACAGGAAAEGSLVCADPGRALVDLSADADLLVVGRRGQGRLAATLLGSVSSACVRHARCPVVVVPDAVRAGLAQNVERNDAKAG